METKERLKLVDHLLESLDTGEACRKAEINNIRQAIKLEIVLCSNKGEDLLGEELLKELAPRIDKLIIDPDSAGGHEKYKRVVYVDPPNEESLILGKHETKKLAGR